MVWMVVSTVAVAGPALVVRPLAPSAGVRVGDRVHLDVLLQPILGWSRDDNTAVGSEVSRSTRFGAALDLVGRAGFSTKPSRASWAVAARGSWTEFRFSDELIEGLPSPRARFVQIWTGPSFTLDVGRGWAVGGDVELVTGQIGDSRTTSVVSGLDFAIGNETANQSLGLLTGGHVWLSYRPQ